MLDDYQRAESFLLILVNNPYTIINFLLTFGCRHMVNILYLAHDLADASSQKRVRMLKAGGAEVVIAGFHRSETPPSSIFDCPVINLGRTYNANFKQRIFSVIKVLLKIKQLQNALQKSDVIIARNLEMLSIAVRGKRLYKTDGRVVYESLDIHRLLLRKDLIGKTLRTLEEKLCKHVDRLWTSSPAFVHGYFEPLSKIELPITIVENRIFDPENILKKIPAVNPADGNMWVIGWFGAIRCHKSLNILCDLVKKRDDVRVIIRGRPSYDQFDDFDKIVRETDGIDFMGPYNNPEDLAEIYSEVHFTWAIDMFEEGLNSSWLLPNRLYEGGLFSSIPIADKNVYTGRYLEEISLGILVDKVDVDNLCHVFDSMTVDAYNNLKTHADKIDKSQWVCSIEECKGLIKEIVS